MSLQPHLTPAVIAAVIGAGALHAGWNAIAKQVPDRLMAFAWIGITSAITGGLVLSLTGMPAPAAVWFAVASAVIHVGYDLALMNSYRLGALNQTYPIARGTSPLVVAVGAYFLAGERLSPVALTGIATLAAGLAGLAVSAGRLTSREAPAIGAAILTGLTIAAYTLVDGIGVRRAGDPWAYAALLFAARASAHDCCRDPPARERVARAGHRAARAAGRPVVRRGLRSRPVGANEGTTR